MNKQNFVGSVGNEKKVAATVREEFGGGGNFLTGLAITDTPGRRFGQQGYFTPSLFSQRWKAKAYTLGKRGRNALRRDKQCAVVCGRKPHHLKPTTPPVTHNALNQPFFLPHSVTVHAMSCFQQKTFSSVIQ